MQGNKIVSISTQRGRIDVPAVTYDDCLAVYSDPFYPGYFVAGVAAYGLALAAFSCEHVAHQFAQSILREFDIDYLNGVFEIGAKNGSAPEAATFREFINRRRKHPTDVTKIVCCNRIQNAA